MAPVCSAAASSREATTVPDHLFDALYSRLKAMASRQRVRAGGPATLCTTEIVHETFLRMEEASFRGTHPAQLFAYASQAMRNILTDAARRRAQIKRGGDQERVDFDESVVEQQYLDYQAALHLDRALRALENDDARAARIVEMHYFAGLTLNQIAGLLGIARRTAERDWHYARAFLATHSDGG
jgi:RNA polymerase sigma factor (TIGR02999 family)